MEKITRNNKLDWKIKSFPECIKPVRFERSKQIKTNSYLPSGDFPVIDQGQTKIAGWTNDKSAVIKDNIPLIIFGDHTRVFKFIDFPFAIGADGTKLIKPRDDKFCSRYFYYYLRSLNLSSKGYSRHFKLLKESEISYPEIPEQEKIAAILLKIQQAIEVQESIIEAAQELKRSTMQHVFTYGLRGEKTKETEIGRMPESWEVRQIGDFCKVQGGYAFKSSDYQKNGIKLFKISNVSFGKTVWVETSFLSTSYIEKYNEYLLMPGDLLMAMTRPIVSGGIKITRLRNEDCPCLLNQRVARFNTSLSINKEYLFQVLFNPYFINAIGLGALGSQQPNISATQIEQIRIPFTDLDEQKEIADILKSIDKKIELHTSKKIAFQDLFKTMLNKLMTGVIRVRDSDIDTSCVLEMENRG